MSNLGLISEDDSDMLAAEYALGILDGQARLGAERRTATDPGLCP